VIQSLAKILSIEPFDNQNFNEAEIGTAGAFSRVLDGQKVDIWMKNQKLYIQCKNMAQRPNYHQILESMPKDEIRVVAHNYTKKAKTNFVTQGQYAILPMEDFYKLLSYARKELFEGD
jgi:hypothetical protein